MNACGGGLGGSEAKAAAVAHTTTPSSHHQNSYYESFIGLSKGVVMLVLLPLVYRYALKGRPPNDYLFATVGIALGMGKCVREWLAEWVTHTACFLRLRTLTQRTSPTPSIDDDSLFPHAGPAPLPGRRLRRHPLQRAQPGAGRNKKSNGSTHLQACHASHLTKPQSHPTTRGRTRTCARSSPTAWSRRRRASSSPSCRPWRRS